MPTSSELYSKRKNQLFEVLSVAIHDPNKIKAFLKSYEKGSWKGKFELLGQGAQWVLENRAKLSALSYKDSYYSPEAFKLIQILKGKGLKDSDSNFYIKLLKDPDTLAFLKNNEIALNYFLDEIFPTFLSIAIHLKATEPLIKILSKMRIDESFIQKTLSIDLLIYIKLQLKTPEKIFDSINALVGALSAPMTPLRQNAILFSKKILPILLSFTKEPIKEAPNKALISIISSFFVNRQDATLINNLSDLVNRPELEEIMTQLPNFISDNKTEIVKKVMSSLPSIKKKFQAIPQDFSETFMQKLLETSIDLSMDLFPFSLGVLQKVFVQKNHTTLVNIMKTIKAVKGDKAASKEYIKSLLDSIFKLDVDEYVIDNFPRILQRHAQPLDEVIKEFLTQTQSGRELILYVKTHKVLDILKYHMPQIISIIQGYTQGGPWFFQACQLLKDKAVLKLLISTLSHFIAYKYRQRVQTGLIRRLKIGEPMKTLLKSYEPGGNLGTFFKKNAQNSKHTLKYSLMTRDLSGLNISTTLSNSIIEDFKFDKATLDNVSFENSKIINCSFKNTHFKNYINFKGVLIDEISLKTLKPAIDYYNKYHPNHKIAYPTLLPNPTFTLPTYKK